jgi:predicted AlkP superfamily pyrophosphatase or phosphodiesterase
LERNEFLDEIDIMITGDHGMTPISKDRVILV